MNKVVVYGRMQLNERGGLPVVYTLSLVQLDDFNKSKDDEGENKNKRQRDRKTENDSTDYFRFPAVSAKLERGLPRLPAKLYLSWSLETSPVSVSVESLAQASGRCNNDWAESERITTTKRKPSTT